MRVELIELLRAREIRHPSRVVLLESKCDSNLRIEVAGYPWWLEKAVPGVDGKITFHIEGITDGMLNAEMFEADIFNEDLEKFEACLLSECEWANGAHSEVYCNGPAPNPMEIYARLHDFFLSTDCPFPPTRYLNMGASGSFSEFVEIAASRSFLLCRGPETICQVVCKELERRETTYSVIRGESFSSGLISVQLWESHLICRSAYAVFEN